MKITTNSASPAPPPFPLRIVGMLMIAVWFYASVVIAAPSAAIQLRIDDLARRLNTPALLVVDARPASEYAKGHIPDAVNVPVNQTFGPAPRPDLLAPLSHIQRLFRKAGINNDSNIVIYDNGDYIDAARLFWALEVVGHEQVAILNGGMPGWRKRGLKVSTEPTRAASGDFVPSLNPDVLATRFSVRLGLNRPERILIDVRTEAEYAGLESKSKRFGHIPGAISIPWTRNLEERNGVTMLRPPGELRAIYGKAFDTQGNRVIAYCNKGKQAALTYFVLRRLGEDVSAYDGSWFEWGNDDSLPIINPAAKTAPGS